MKETELIDQPFSCANNTKSERPKASIGRTGHCSHRCLFVSSAGTPTETCSLEDMCGFGGFDGKAPDQTFRFVLPIWLHAGVVHALLNLLCVFSDTASVIFGLI